MATTGTKTVLDIVTAATQKAGIVGLGDTPSSEVAASAKDELERMLKSWQTAGYNVFAKTSGELTLTTNANHTLDPVRPLRILSARYRETATSSEIPMIELTRDEYDELPLKTTTGVPTQFYYDRQREAAVFYVWPVLASVSAQKVLLTYERELEDIDALTDVIDLPGEWWDAAVYNLAMRMMHSVPLKRQNQEVTAMAMKLLDEALGFDREGSVTFGCDH